MPSNGSTVDQDFALVSYNTCATEPAAPTGVTATVSGSNRADIQWTVNGAAAYVRTPTGGMHAYFAGTDQHNGRLPSHHLDFRSKGGYVVAPPSAVNGRQYELVKRADGQGGLDWAAVTRQLETER